MAITANPLPAQWPDFTLPVDASLQFASAQTITASGYVNNAAAQLAVGPGRFDGFLAVNVTALFNTTGDEYYQLGLLGSNSSSFANGTAALLTMFDIATVATAGWLATVTGIYPTIPPAGRAGWLRAQPFTNYIGGGYAFQYLKLYCLMGGTTPSITLSAWLTEARIST
jgi:hypothetical protein